MQEHGRYTITVRHRILVMRILDAWNLETAIRFRADMEAAAKVLAGSPWAILCDLTRWQLSTPDVAAEIARQALVLDDMGRTHNAIVACDEGMRQSIMAKAIQSSTQRPVLEFFADETAAFDWLAACGFTLEAQLEGSDEVE